MKLIDKGLTLYRNQYLLSRSFIVISASLFSSVLAYLFQLIAGRYFSAENYGIIISLFSLSGLIPLALIFFTNGIPKLVAEVKDIDYPNRISSLFFTIFKLNILISSIIFLVMTIFSKQIATYLQIQDSKIIVIYALSMSLGILFYEVMPFLQGLLRFKAHSFMTICAALGKFSSILVVIYLGLNIKGLYLGLATVATIIGLLGFIIIKKNLTRNFFSVDWIDFKTLLTYSLSAAFAIIGINAIQNIDVILVKHHFIPAVAGTYASASVIGKIIFFAASPIGIVMLPICAEKYKKGLNYYRTFLVSITIAMLIASSIAIVYIIFPDFVVSVFFGEKHMSAAALLPYYAVYMVLFTLMFLTAQFFIAISRFTLAALTLIGALIQLISIEMFHENIQNVILINIFAVSVVVLIFLFSLTIPKRYRITLKGN